MEICRECNNGFRADGLMACNACGGTGWVGDCGPGIEGNAEHVPCDCGKLVEPEFYHCRHCGELPKWIDVPMPGRWSPRWDGKLVHKCAHGEYFLMGAKTECVRDWNEVHGLAPIAGWLYVKCDTCGDTWRETSRDIKAVSSVECSNGCEHGGDTHVWKRERCFLPTDRSGNLREYTKERLSSGLGHNKAWEARANDEKK